MNTISFVLHLLLGCMIIAPFVWFSGCVMISCYFKMKDRHESEKKQALIDAMMKVVKKHETMDA